MYQCRALISNTRISSEEMWTMSNTTDVTEKISTWKKVVVMNSSIPYRLRFTWRYKCFEASIGRSTRNKVLIGQSKPVLHYGLLANHRSHMSLVSRCRLVVSKLRALDASLQVGRVESSVRVWRFADIIYRERSASRRDTCWRNFLSVSIIYFSSILLVVIKVFSNIFRCL